MKYLIDQLVFAVLTMLAAIVLISAIIYQAPVDLSRMYFGQRTDEAAVNQMRKQMHLDEPVSKRIAYYLIGLSPIRWEGVSSGESKGQGKGIKIYSGETKVLYLSLPDLGTSYSTGRSVWEMLRTAVPPTLILGLISMIIASIFGIGLGLLGAAYQGKWQDQAILSFCTLGISVPSYVSAIFFSLLFGFVWSGYTGLDVQGSLFSLDDFGEVRFTPQHVILPALALGTRPVAMIAQMTRVAYLEVIRQDYIRTARSKGIATAQLIRKHILKNAMNPIFTTISSWFASVLTGAFFVEYVFNYKGLGDLTITALHAFDIPVILGASLFTISVFIMINTITDIVYHYIDPRVRI